QDLGVSHLGRLLHHDPLNARVAAGVHDLAEIRRAAGAPLARLGGFGRKDPMFVRPLTQGELRDGFEGLAAVQTLLPEGVVRSLEGRNAPRNHAAGSSSLCRWGARL